MTTSDMRARSTGASGRNRTPPKIQDLQDEVTGLKAQVTGLKMNLDAWTKTMEKRVDDHNKEFDKKMGEFQVNGTAQLGALEKKFENQYAAIIAGLADLSTRVANIAGGPPPPPPIPTPTATADPWVQCGPYGGTSGGGGKGAGKGTGDPYPGGKVHIPAPKGMHGISEFDGKNYLTWKPAVKDHLTDEGRDEIGLLLKWAEERKDPITKDVEKDPLVTPVVPFHVDQASTEIYRAMGRVLQKDIALKYRTNAGEGCGLEVWRKLFQDNEGMSDQVVDVQFKQFSMPARTKTLDELAKVLPEWETIGIKLEAAGEVLGERQRHSALMQLIPSVIEDTIKTKQHNGEMSGYSASLKFVKSMISDKSAERNASLLNFGPKIAGSNSKGKGPNDMDVGHVGQEQEKEQEEEDWSGGVYSLLENLLAAVKGKGKGKGKGKAEKGWQPTWSTQWQQQKGGGEKGDKGGGKGGKGKDGGKGAVSQFQGYCNHCGAWGHRKSECRKLDREMAAKGKGRGGNINPVEEEEEENKEEAEAEPEADDGWGGAQFQLQRGMPAKATLGAWLARPVIKTHNRFCKLTPLVEEEEEDHDVPDLDIPELCGDDNPPKQSRTCRQCDCHCTDEDDDCWTLPKVQALSPSGACSSKKWAKTPRTVAIIEKAPRDPELHARLLNAIAEGTAARRKGVRIIVDSGACDHVAPKNLIKGAKITKGKAFGENYVGADGGTFPNLGEQRLCLSIASAGTAAGSVACTFQLADISKPVLSVSKLTENGCDVRFTKKGGIITTASGMRAPFQKRGGVYILTADVGPWTGGAAVSAVTNPTIGLRSTKSTENKLAGSIAARSTSFQRQG